MYFFLFLFFIASPCFAQVSQGARSYGMAQCTAALTDPWSVNGNPAGVSLSGRVFIGLSHTRQHLVTDLATAAIAVVIPSHGGAFSLSAERYGFDSFTQTGARLAYSRKFGRRVSAGLALSCSRQAIAGYGSELGAAASAGIHIACTESLTAGAFIRDFSTKHFPTKPLIGLGLAWQASDRLLLLSDFYTDSPEMRGIRAGLEYAVLNRVLFRGGLQSKPFVQYAGLGWRPGSLQCELAVAAHPVLGLSPQISAGYAF
ncbi:hypothetical protein C7T94_12075 [Pedobacter yulinensis]|uniref:PorV/PorQ family protein n=1 Tax=Pedobacter yulinensis TaxID=2126353 RepID=A0A2T3HLI6_9SPHI|nr:hypothetical protein [Pedobacter yulinensis]PST83312.1 hypothetical protein C7T94_12075 [Pedobacter yulinensis]